jgi:Holliday junction resolvase RusA-like endonuclease
MPRAFHETRPDLDNLAKSTKDALTGILWRDDSQIAILNARKVIAAGDEQPCVEVQVMQL